MPVRPAFLTRYRGKTQACQVRIINRSLQKGLDLARELGIDPLPVDPSREMVPDIVVNATSVGMHQHSDETSLDKEHLKQGMLVMDLVYCPLKTRLLREAEEKSCRMIDGLEMLACQGAAQLEIWTGCRPDASEIKQDLARALA